MALKHMVPEQESHKDTAGRSAFAPAHLHQLILTTAFNSVYPQVKDILDFIQEKRVGPQKGMHLSWVSAGLMVCKCYSFLGEAKNIECPCRFKLGCSLFSAEQQGILKVQQKSGKKKTRKSPSSGQLTSLQLKYCWQADISQEKKFLNDTTDVL